MQDRLSPTDALERIFEVIRQEAASNPSFARRVLDAADVTVVFTGTDAVSAVDPILVAAKGDYAAFRESFMTFTDRDLKALIKGFGLATDDQVKGVKSKPKASGLVDLMWDGATRMLQERRAR